MPNSAQRLVIDAGPVGRDSPAEEAGRSGSERAAGPPPSNKIVPLFSEPNVSEPNVSEPNVSEPERADGGSAETDWPAALDLIRDAGARVRRARDFAQEVSRHSQSIIRRSVEQTENAERRAAAAEASAAAAVARALKAEELARLSEARARLAEKQAEAAKAAEADAQLWLKRIHACLNEELSDLMVVVD